jgi:CysZ protein
MTENPVSGASHIVEGLRLITRPGLRRFVVIPFLVNVMVFSLLIWIGIGQFENFMAWLLPEDAWYSFLRWILWPLFAISLLFIVFFTFTALANLIAAPFNALLAEKVEQHLTGTPVEQTGSLLREIGPAILSELRKLAYYLVRAVPLLILFVIPGLNLAAPVFWALFNAWFLTIEYVDYPMGNHGMNFSSQLSVLRRRRIPALSFGGGLTLLMLVPLLNFLAMPAAVAGATSLWIHQLQSADTDQPSPG